MLTSPTSKPIVAGPTGSPSSAYARPAAPSSISSASDLKAYIESRTFWHFRPTVFGSSLNEAFSDSGAAVIGTNGAGFPDTYSTSGVISQGASLRGEPLLVVGRIKTAVQSTVDGNTGASNFAMITPEDIELTGPHGSNAVYALVEGDGSDVSDGALVYFPAVVAAVGQATGGQQTAYLIGLSDLTATLGYGDGGEPSVSSLARDFKGK